MSEHAGFRDWAPSFFGLAAIWGASFLFIKLGVQVLPPVYVALFRIGLGAITAVILLYATGGHLPSLRTERHIWWHTVYIGLVGVALPFTLFPYGEQRVSSVLAGIWNSMTPLVTLPVAVWVFRTERFTVRRVLGLLLGVAGALVLLGIWSIQPGSGLAGQLMCAGAACCYGLTGPYTHKHLAHSPVRPIAITSCQLIVATVALLIAAPIVAGAPDLSAVTFKAATAIVVLGCVGTGFAYVLMLRNVKLMGASSASNVTYVIPVIATLLGIVVMHEPVTWNEPLGAVLVLAGVGVASMRARRRYTSRSRA